MLEINGVGAEEELVTAIFALNQKFGEFCTFDLLTDIGELEKKCYDEEDRLIIKKFESLWENRKQKLVFCSKCEKEPVYIFEESDTDSIYREQKEEDSYEKKT